VHQANSRLRPTVRACAALLRNAGVVLALALVYAALASAPASAQNMNIALSRLRIAASDAPDAPCSASFSGLTREFCSDDDAYRRVMADFAGAMTPPVLTPAGTRGVRGLYIGFESWITNIDHGAEHWHRAVEGDGRDSSRERSRFVDEVLAWGRVNVRKGLPFGFELGTNLGYLANTSYFTLGAEVRWALFEGFREDIGWIPDLAVRGSVQTLIGDGEFNVTVPSVDLILSEPFVVASTLEVVPWISAQVAFPFVDSELVDLTPETSAFSGCSPDPSTPDGSLPSPYCRMNGAELNQSVVFPSMRSTRYRVGGGLQLRYEMFTLLSSFTFDATRPREGDSSIPNEVDRQWTVSVGAGLNL
jgi:hypothetical protein